MKQEIQSSPDKAERLIARAMSLADADECEAALDLLQAQRSKLANVPADYDAAIGRLCLQAGRTDEAIDYLTRAQLSYGDKLPGGVVLKLADALLRAGRVEAAGFELNRSLKADRQIRDPAQAAAIDAYLHRPSDILDSGPPTPWRILAKAQALIAEKQRQAAPRLLAEHRNDWDSVPEEYDTALCRLAMRCGDKNAAVAWLSLAIEGSRNPVPVMMRKALGTALFAAGRVDESAPVLDAAIKDGAKIARADLQIVVASYRDKLADSEPIEARFPDALTLVDYEKKLVYLPLPKNACTLLKATFVMNTSHREAYLAQRMHIHPFCNRLTLKPLQRDLIMGPDYFRFVVLREPMQRVLSAYLDKFVRRRNVKDRNVRLQQMTNTIRTAQAIAGISYDRQRSITFEEFVRYLATANDGEFNMHWMPQFRTVGTDLSIYSHVGKVERLKETLELLESRFGFVQEAVTKQHLPTIRRHTVKYSETASLKEPYRALPHELDEVEFAMPVPELFFTPELKALLTQRYAIDVALYARA